MTSAVWSSGDPSALLHQQLAAALSTMGDGQYWEETISPSSIRQLLQEADPSSSTHNLLKALKWLLASMSKGRDVSDFFALVVKMVGATHLEARKMVYLYLVQYANHNASTRELSLLSINAFQRGLADAEAGIRALALRVLTALHIADILQIQLLGLQKCARDKSPYVRKCAANAIMKLQGRCDDEQKELLWEVLRELLDQETSPMVLTAVLVAFAEVCPYKLEWLHGSFRKICHLLTDFEEWGQVVIIDTMARYLRTFFREPVGWKEGSAELIDRERRVRRTLKGMEVAMTSNGVKPSVADQAAASGVTLPERSEPSVRKIKRRVVKKGFYSDEEDQSTEEEIYETPEGEATSLSGAMRQRNIMGVSNGEPLGLLESAEDMELSEDHRRFLQAAMPLLKSRNAGVVLAVCSLQYYCGVSSIKVRSAMGKALVRIHRDRREIQYAVLMSIRTLATECPSAFAPFLHDFFVNAMDPPFTRLIKLDILTSLALEPAAIEVVLKELRSYVKHGDDAFVCASIRAVGRVVELARIVFDRHGQKSGNAMKERSEANRIALNCLYGLVTITEASSKPAIVGECVTVMQHILQMLVSDALDHGDLMAVQDPNHVQDRALRRILLLLVSTLSQRVPKAESEENGDDESVEVSEVEQLGLALPPEATASSLWIMGEYLCSVSTREGTLFGKFEDGAKASLRVELLRLATRAFPELAAVEKEQCIHLASKMLVSRSDSSIESSLCEMVLSMGRVDVNPNVRDRARYESCLLRSAALIKVDRDSLDDMPPLVKNLTIDDVKRVLLERKPASSSLPLEDELSIEDGARRAFRFGTLSSMVGHKARSAYISLPKWSTENSSSSLREPPKEQSTSSVMPSTEHKPNGGSAPSTSNFYEDSSDDDSSSSSESSSSDSDSSSESSSDDDDSSSSSESEAGAQGNLLGLPMPPATSAMNGVAPSQPRAAAPMVSTVAKEDESSSSSDDSSDDDDSSSDSSDDEDGTVEGTLLSMASPTAVTTGTGGLASEFQGMTLAASAPAPTEAALPPGPWMALVRPEHAHGLSIRGRFLRKKPLQLEVSLEAKGSTTIRRLSIRGTNVNLAQLAPGQPAVTFVVPIDPPTEDRDGTRQWDVKTSMGHIPVTIPVKLADALVPTTVGASIDFAAELAKLQGLARVLSHKTVDRVHAAVGQVGEGQYAGRLPVSQALVLIETTDTHTIVGCADAVAANSILNGILATTN